MVLSVKKCIFVDFQNKRILFINRINPIILNLNFYMKRRIVFTALITGLLALWGCYPGGPDYAEEMDVVLTKHNADYDFVSKATYAMPNKIVKITGNAIEPGGEPEYVPDLFASQILGRVATNMANLGWVKVDVSQNPDLLLLPAAWETTTVYYWYDYWYWWYGGYYPYWPYYPPVYASSYTTGTFLMTLQDPDVLQGSGSPVNQWSGAVNGLMTGTYDINRVNTAIDKAFTASPYLNTK
jgi:hypothetical protein